MNRTPRRNPKWLTLGSWVWLVVFALLGSGVLLHTPRIPDISTRAAAVELHTETSQSKRANTNEEFVHRLPASDIARTDSHSVRPAAHSTRAIETIHVGDRVLAANPEITQAERDTWEEPNWDQWIKLSLRMPKADGSQLAIELLRPEWWVISQTRFVVEDRSDRYTPVVANDSDEVEVVEKPIGGPLRPLFLHVVSQCEQIAKLDLRLVNLSIEMDLPELGLTGDAIVEYVEPASSVATGEGSVVTATFHHTSGDVIDLSLAKDSSNVTVLGTTSNHPFWSVDRGEFVQAETLEKDERVLTYGGETLQVTDKVAQSVPVPVYNLEVYGEHVYYVGEFGVLVHNAKKYSQSELLGTMQYGYLYRLQKNGKTVYHGIAEGATPELARANLLARLSDHGKNKNGLFDTMDVMHAGRQRHGQLRTLESQVIRESQGVDGCCLNINGGRIEARYVSAAKQLDKPAAPLISLPAISKQRQSRANLLIDTDL